jgi:hypothetical protein
VSARSGCVCVVGGEGGGQHQHSGVDAFSCEGIDVSGSVPDDEEVVVEGGGQSLGPQTQGSGPHALDLCVGA